MRKLVLLMLVLSSLVACKNQTLDKEGVHNILEKSGKYPIIHSRNIYTKDSEDGRKLLDAGLEKDGLVSVERNRKAGDNHAPVIEFSADAKSFFLAPDKGQLSSVQKVKTAEEVLDEITALKTNEKGDVAAASYTTKFINITPFAKLEKNDFSAGKQYTVKLILTDKGWNLE